MRKVTTLLALGFICLNCNKSLKEIHCSGECKQYYKLMKSDWLKKDGFYEIKGNPPYLEKGEYRLKYFKEKCLLDLPKKKLVKLLGKPSQTVPKEDWELYVYCLNSKCSQKFNVVIDSLDVVKEVFLSPEAIERD